MAHPPDGGDGGQVQGVAGVALEGAHAPLAQNHVFVAGGHDVLRRHDPLLVGVGQAPLEQDGLGQLARLLQQVEVLHIPRADLHQIHLFLKQAAVPGGHDLGHDGQSGVRPGLQQQLQAVRPHALEGVGGGAGLEGPAPEQGRPRRLHVPGHPHDLILALHRAGPGDDGKAAPAADGHAGHVHHRVLRVELPVGLLVRLLHPHDPLHVVVHGELVHVDVGGVPHQAQDGAAHPVGDPHGDAVIPLQRVHQGVDVFLAYAGLHDNNHINNPFSKEKAHDPRRAGHELP